MVTFPTPSRTQCFTSSVDSAIAIHCIFKVGNLPLQAKWRLSNPPRSSKSSYFIALFPLVTLCKPSLHFNFTLIVINQPEYLPRAEWMWTNLAEICWTHPRSNVIQSFCQDGSQNTKKRCVWGRFRRQNDKIWCTLTNWFHHSWHQFQRIPLQRWLWCDSGVLKINMM